ncbi:DUF3598 family protein [Nostocales cyanobacterium LEGE 12452]|nr:DUF3598 family protein [Nostocales cyanobacterium LEGE 12452]
MSDNRVSITAKIPLTAEKQWETFMVHHCGRWQGILVRFDAAGHVLDILDSLRSLIPSEDRRTVTHSLDFRSRMTETVTQKQWVLTLGNPLIIHPADPEAYLLFNPDSLDIMLGRDRTGQGFYFEPYLLASGKRTSVVVMYNSAANSPQPNMFSFFRESKEGAAKPWWSEQTHCKIDRVDRLKLATQAVGGTYVSLDEMAQLPVSPQPLEVQGDFLKIQFPDAIDIVISIDRFKTPYYASMCWTPDINNTLRSCTLIYERPNQKADVFAS